MFAKKSSKIDKKGIINLLFDFCLYKKSMFSFICNLFDLVGYKRQALHKNHLLILENHKKENVDVMKREETTQIKASCSGKCF